MPWGRLRRIWPGRHGSQLVAETWERALQCCPLPGWLPAWARERVRSLAVGILDSKTFTPVAGMQLESWQRTALAAQMAVPLVGLDLGWLRGWREVVVYPEGFRARRSEVDEAGVLIEGEQELAGEAWPQGPLVLAWADLLEDLVEPEAGFNVVFHEMAHKLDASNGAINGMPALHADMRIGDWTRVFEQAYALHLDEVERGVPTWVDPYAASAPEEFFAVLSEHFLMQPAAVEAEFPEVYAQLRAFYRVDPLAMA